MKLVVADLPLLSGCQDIKETFEAMFYSESVPKDFKLSRTKASYLITDALSPYFKKQMLSELESAYFTLCYDETTNAASYKELQIAVRYWSEHSARIVTRHLQTFYIGGATAEDLFKKLSEALDNGKVSRSKLLMVSCDGPNVNKSVLTLMNESMKLLKRKPLVDIGTCNIHIMHNAFKKGMEELGVDASDLIFQVYDFFHGWPSRWEDFVGIQKKLGLPNHKFLKHVSSRWLSLEPAGNRLIEQWSAVEAYFINFIPKHSSKKAILKSAKYKNILGMLKNPTMKAEVHFACSSAQLFTRFTGFFQKEEPLIHNMYDQLKSVTNNIMIRFCISSATFSAETLDSDKNFLPLCEINCGDGVSEILKTKHESIKNAFFLQARNHYIAACKHIFKKSSLKSTPLLKYLSCISPSERKRSDRWKYIVRVAQALPIDYSESSLIDEWRLLSLEAETPESDKERIDIYWHQFFLLKNTDGTAKYPEIKKVIKAALSLAHGSADVERGFSSSIRIVTHDRASMSERTLDAHLNVKGAVCQLHNGKVHDVPISKELLDLAFTAHKRYTLYLEEQRLIKEREKKEKEDKEQEQLAEKERQEKMLLEKKSIEEKESALKILRVTEEQKRETADRLLQEANSMLKEALKKKDFVGATAAQAILESARTVSNEAVDQKKQADQIEKNVGKRKSSLITSFFNKKPRKQ